MRLINTATLELHEFFGAWPPYAILSHTWEDGEVTFQEFQSLETARRKRGFDKIQTACRQAAHDDLAWCWVDTCCIDKSSSAELSEAINSMFAWYQNARIYYAFLGDVEDSNDHHQFIESRWFTRGWTLQELLAPSSVRFYSKDWDYIGDTISLQGEISRASGIERHFITGRSDMWEASIARKMSWMARRITTRVEDFAYCLLGIFEVNMPLLYGEGTKAFIRLQEEILKQSDDQTIFCWEWIPDIVIPSWHSILAPFPVCFRASGRLQPLYSKPKREWKDKIRPYHITNAGLSIWIKLVRTIQPGLYLAALQVSDDSSPNEDDMVCVPVRKGRVYHRVDFPAQPVSVRFGMGGKDEPVYINCTSGRQGNNILSQTHPTVVYEATCAFLFLLAPNVPTYHSFKMDEHTTGVNYWANKSLLTLKLPNDDNEALGSVRIAVFKWSEHSLKTEHIGLSVRLRSIESGSRDYISRCTMTSWYGSLVQSNLLKKLESDAWANDSDSIVSRIGQRTVVLGPATSCSSNYNTKNLRMVYFM